jgi:hypothetical protein
MKKSSTLFLFFSLLLGAPLVSLRPAADVVAPHAADQYAAKRAELRALLRDYRISYRLDQTLEKLLFNPLLAKEEYYNLTENERDTFMRRLWTEYDYLKHEAVMHAFLMQVIGLSNSAAARLIGRVRQKGIAVFNKIIAPLLKKLVISNAPRGDAAFLYDDARYKHAEEIEGGDLSSDEAERRSGKLTNNLSLLDQALLRVVDGAVVAGRTGKRAISTAYDKTEQAGNWLRSWANWALGRKEEKGAK